MAYSIDVNAPRGGSYNAEFGECAPAPVKKQTTARPEPQAEMCMMPKEEILWSTEDGHRAWRALNEGSLKRLINAHWAEHNAEVMSIDLAEQAALLSRATAKPWLQRVFDAVGITSMRAEYVPTGNGTLAMSGGGCRPPHPYRHVKALCDKVKVDLKAGKTKGTKTKPGKKVPQRSRIFFVLTHAQIVKVCQSRGYNFISISKATKCRLKYRFETKGKTIKTNIYSEVGVARATFDAAGQYYLPTGTNYDIKDWKKHAESIPIYFERCFSGRHPKETCEAKVIVCLNEKLIKALTFKVIKTSDSP